MTRRDLFRHIAKVGVLAGSATIPWSALERLGLVDDFIAEAATLPLYKQITTPTLISDMSSGWTKNAGTGTVSYDSSLGTWPDGTTGGVLFDQSTNGGVLNARFTLAGAPVDLSRTSNITIRMQNTNGVTPQRIVLLMGNSGLTSHFQYFWNSTNSHFSPTHDTLVIDRASFTTGAGTPNWNAITQIQIQCDSLSGTQSDVLIGGIWANVYSRPTVLQWFDDCNDTDYTNAYPVMSALGLPATIAFLSSALDAATKLTTANCNTLYAAGWDLVNHTTTHPNLTSITAQQVADEFDTCTNVLNTNGWTRTIDVAVYPQGATNTTVDGVAASRFRIARGGRVAFTNFQQAQFKGIDYPLRLVTHATLDNGTTSLATAKTAVGNCIRLGSQLNVFYHQVVNGGSSVTWELDASFTPYQQFLAQLRDANVIDVQTISQWDKQYRFGRKPR